MFATDSPGALSWLRKTLPPVSARQLRDKVSQAQGSKTKTPESQSHKKQKVSDLSDRKGVGGAEGWSLWLAAEAQSEPELNGIH
ncbi:hypothetical protein HBH56_069080 [Parastagonospora nodorum]|uniref:Uncharacterized protein n=1 Tax=Phaeosphaeria nodorum (strain SN15 / ATCC MYA-4574 / FGSC 10173) TaxID=321614 RepID=A0A7U2EVB8_PHANO|nr:hypothetical protein HBH56_069080 [Parastagonospora nodorum]QRC93557.1 hypothetical protein JI435_404060 [Parastagonospora nodorum SN15]KAH3955029.1 hypothetical protein HBH53_015320 [Parastagonospora nodorum]KAH3986065.1 hypothetical protein HBH52_046480 [Parastagonospora nodorum]KAH4040505.1 hypothetical protein HBI09_028830 [Parastagonospora nodorum]